MSQRDSKILRERAADIATISVAALAIVFAGSVTWDQVIGGGGSGTEVGVERTLSDWEAVKASGHRMGPEDATVVIVEFGDYECPYCKKAEQILRGLRRAYPDDLAVVFRHFPFTSHPSAYSAARLAECGAEQDHFGPVHTILFAQVELGDLDPVVIARASQVPDLSRFVSCARQTEPVNQIEQDLAAAKGNEIDFVPALILDGILLGPNADSTSLDNLIRQRLGVG